MRLKSIWFLLLFAAASLQAAVPNTLNYQGRLKILATGQPVPDSTGNTVVFGLFSGPSGGSALWTETWNVGTSHVATKAGLFNVVLGSFTPLSLPFDQPYYLEVTWYNGATPETMTPRQPLTSGPYAFRAKVADALAPPVDLTGPSGYPAAVLSVSQTSTVNGGFAIRGFNNASSTAAVAGFSGNTTPPGPGNFSGIGVYGIGAVGLLGQTTLANGVGVVASVSTTNTPALYAENQGTGEAIAGNSVSGTGVSASGFIGLRGSTNLPGGLGIQAQGGSGRRALQVQGDATFDSSGGPTSVSFNTHVDFSNAFVTGLSGAVPNPLSLNNNLSGPVASFGNSGSGAGLSAQGTFAAITASAFNGNPGSQAYGVSASANASSGSTSTYGVYGEANSPGPSYGLYGKSNGGALSHGVYGEGGAYGVYGSSPNGTGLRGDNNNNFAPAILGENSGGGGSPYGIIGRAANSSSAVGILGTNSFGTPNFAQAAGVLGYDVSGSGAGVTGNGGFMGVSASGGTYGVFARGLHALHAESADGYALYAVGQNNLNAAVLAYNYNGADGIQGYSTGSTDAVYGENDSFGGNGVMGYSNSGTGVRGESADTSSLESGVEGVNIASFGTTLGVHGIANTSNTGFGVMGEGSRYGVFGDVSSMSPGFNVGVLGTYSGAAAPSSLQSGAGVAGMNDSVGGYGLYGRNDSGTGLYAEGGTGVAGRSNASGVTDMPAGVSATTLSPSWGTGLYANGYLGAVISANQIGAIIGGGNAISALDNPYYPASLATPTWGLVSYASSTAVSATGGTTGVFAAGGNIGVQASGAFFGVNSQATGATGVGVLAENNNASANIAAGGAALMVKGRIRVSGYDGANTVTDDPSTVATSVGYSSGRSSGRVTFSNGKSSSIGSYTIAGLGGFVDAKSVVIVSLNGANPNTAVGVDTGTPGSIRIGLNPPTTFSTAGAINFIIINQQ